MTLLFIAILIAILVMEALLTAYFSGETSRPRWMRWLDGGIGILLIVFTILVIRQVFTLLKL